MDFYEKIKRFVGLQRPPDLDDRHRNLPEPPQNKPRESYESPLFNEQSRHFNIFTDPLEIHRYFEQQMEDMLRTFGFSEFGDSFSHHFDLPQIDEFPQNDHEAQAGELREQFLKPSFQKAVPDDQPKQDQDIDGKLDIRDWGSVFRGENSVGPYQREVAPKGYFFGQSVTSKSIVHPDGTTETHHTVRDNQGNEQTTITRRMADKEYSITKTRNKDGKEETIENFINVDEKNVDKFFPLQKVPELDQKPWQFFDRFFK